MPKQDYRKIRQEIAALAEERRQVEAAPLPKSELLARLDEVIAHHAADVSSDMSGLINDRYRDFLFGGETSDIDAGTLRSALCAFAPAAVRVHYLKTIDAYLAGKSPLSTGDRKKRLAELDAELHRLAVDEERSISEAEAGGSPISRRIDIDPEIFWKAHGPDGTRAKFRQFEFHNVQLSATVQTVREAMNVAQREVGRTERNLAEHRRTAGRTGSPVPFRTLPDGQRAQDPAMLISQNPRVERRLLEEVEAAKATFAHSQGEYQRIGETYSSFRGPYDRLRSALARRAAQAA